MSIEKNEENRKVSEEALGSVSSAFGGVILSTVGADAKRVTHLLRTYKTLIYLINSESYQ